MTPILITIGLGMAGGALMYALIELFDWITAPKQTLLSERDE